MKVYDIGLGLKFQLLLENGKYRCVSNIPNLNNNIIDEPNRAMAFLRVRDIINKELFSKPITV